MSEQLTRFLRIEAGRTPGEFQMILATESEASDGHILNIAGGEIPERMPLLDGHWNSATDTMGSVVGARKDMGEDPPQLLATGQIEMAGDGVKAEIRRDLALMIDKGHVNAVSIRWDDIKSTKRVNLPSDHPFFVDAETETGPARWGLFFEQWRALEGSVVALPADKEALIQRSMETEGAVSDYWRSAAKHVPEMFQTGTVGADPDPVDPYSLNFAPAADASMIDERVRLAHARLHRMDEDVDRLIASHPEGVDGIRALLTERDGRDEERKREAQLGRLGIVADPETGEFLLVEEPDLLRILQQVENLREQVCNLYIVIESRIADDEPTLDLESDARADLPETPVADPQPEQAEASWSLAELSLLLRKERALQREETKRMIATAIDVATGKVT